MANGITGGFAEALGIETDAGTKEMKQAIAALEAVGVPNASQLTLPELQKYVIAGVLSPQQYQAISADPETYSKIANQADQTGSSAQKTALQQLGGIVQAGGSTDINKANLLNNVQQTNQAMQASRQGIMQNAQERNASGNGLEFINQLMNEQSNAQNANLGAVNAASNNAQLALQALTQQGSLGGQMQGQENQAAQAKAEAAKQIAEYNSQLQSAANQYNTQNANQAQQMNLANAQDVSNQNTGNVNERMKYNAQVPQTIFTDQMSKAGALANAYGNSANLAQKHAEQQSAFTGSLIGAGATLGGSYLAGNAMGSAMAAGQGYGSGPSAASQPTQDVMRRRALGYAHGGEVQCYAQGGEAHDHNLCMQAGGASEVPGDSEQNDTVPAMLSPHEIVLPRSVAQAPDAPQQAASFVAQTKGIQPTVSSFAEALQKLEENGLELRLSVKGS